MNRLFLYAALLLLTQCSRCKDDPQPKNPEDALPPATQEGKNTFGCLVNGQAWTPQGYNGVANPSFVYDAGLNGGDLSIVAYQTNSSMSSYVTILATTVDHVGVYSLNLAGGVGQVFFTDTSRPSPCGEMYDSRDVNYRRGELVITRLDVANRVVAGTFAVTLVRPGCDTLKITHGRFDARL